MSGKTPTKINTNRIPHRSTRDKGDPATQAPNQPPRTAEQAKEDERREQIRTEQIAIQQRTDRLHERDAHRERIRKQN